MLRRLLSLIIVFSVHGIYAQVPAPDLQNALSAAHGLFKQGRFQESATAYRTIIEKEKSSALAYAGLVQSYLKLDEVKNADESSAQALAVLPQSALIHATRGDVYFRQGLLAEAETEYHAALKLDERCARGWLGMGKIYATVSRQTEARESFAKAHDLDPEDGDILYRWAVLLPYPQNVSGLEKHLAEYRSDDAQEKREHEFVELLRALAGRDAWIQSNAPPQTEIKLETLAPRPGVVQGVTLRAQFNGSVSSLFLLDTGASWMTISRKLAEKIGARRVSDYGFEGASGRASASGYFAWVDKVTIGELQFHDCLVHVSTKNDLYSEYGLVGTDIFNHYLVTIDFPGHKLRLTPLPQPAQGPSETQIRSNAEPQLNTQTFRFGHILLMPTRVNQSAPGLFVLDTGANVSSITTEFAGRVGRMSKQGEPDWHGPGLLHIIENAVLQFSRSPQPARDLIAEDRRSSLSRELGAEVSGFVGFTTLKDMKVIINYRDGWVEFEASK